MRQRWDDYERSAETGPLAVAVRAVIGLAVLAALIGGLGGMFGWFSSTAEVVKEQFGAQASLDKYEWFKNAATALEKKLADIKVYETRQLVLTVAYEGKSRAEWAREDREQSSVWASELAGIKASYNSLAAEYNANMAKFNWRYARTGEIPREFEPYVTE